MDWTDPAVLEWLIPLAVAAIVPLIVWIARRYNEEFDLSDKWIKRVTAVLLVAIPVLVATPGGVWDKVFAAMMAATASQLGYHGVKAVKSKLAKSEEN